MLVPYYRIDLNIMTAILLVIINFLGRARLDRADKLNRAFNTTTWVVIIELIIEASTCLINEQPYPWMIPLSVVLHMSLFITAPILALYWFLLIRRMLITSPKKCNWVSFLLFVPMALGVGLALLSPFFDFVFYIDSANIYHRGFFFNFEMGVLYFYLLLALLIILKNTSSIPKTDWTLLILSTLLPILGGIVQALVYGVLSIWSSVGYSLIILFVFLQQRLVHLDNLTGAWSRESFEYFVTQQVKHRPEEKFGAIFYDVDCLKEINDHFGHSEGDVALKEAVKIIRSVIRDNDRVARMGGDEFIVMINGISKKSLSQIALDIENKFAEYNLNSQKGYRIELSYGADVFDENFHDMNQFFRHIDRLMYDQKNAKKALGSQNKNQKELPK